MPFNQHTFKKTDIIVQSAALLVVGAIWFFDADMAITSFFLGIGGWQLLSMFIHLVQRWNQQFAARRVYQYSLLVLALVFLTSLLYAPVMIWVLYFLLFIAPVLAVYYTVLCYLEFFKKK